MHLPASCSLRTAPALFFLIPLVLIPEVAMPQTYELEAELNEYGQDASGEKTLAALPAGVNVFAATGLDALRELHADGVRFERERVRVEDMPFATAIQVTTLEKPPHPWKLQLVAETNRPLESRDIGFATFYARTVDSPTDSARGRLDFLFERNGEPWTTSVNVQLRPPPHWKRYYFPFEVKRKRGGASRYEAGELRATFNFGYAPQAIQIADFHVTHYPRDVLRGDLPSTPFGYDGMEPDAPWRAAAAERIDRIRKGDLTFVIVDAEGKPVPDAEVTVRMVEHDFPFGTTTNAWVLLDRRHDDGNDRYREELRKLFNAASTENCLKWPAWRNDPQVGIESVEWLREHGFPVHGHVLVWPSWNWSPWRGNEAAIREMTGNVTLLRRRIEDHIQNEVRTLRGKVHEWDVINEPYANHDYMDLLGEEAMVDWFRIAHQSDPEARLFINDYGILACGGNLDDPHVAHYEKTIQFLLDHEAPLGGIGLQSHFGWQVTPPEKLLALLDRFAAFERPLVITEYDHNIADEALQAEFMRDFMTVIFSHPGVEGFYMWGFWDTRHWLNNAPIYRADWSVKPSGEVYKQLVFEDWWTPEQSGRTNNAGEFAVHGFWGKYEIVVNGRTLRAKAERNATGKARLVLQR